MTARAPWREAIDTLGDTTPGPFDALDDVEFPVDAATRSATDIGVWGWCGLAAVAVAACAASAIWPCPWFSGSVCAVVAAIPTRPGWGRRLRAWGRRLYLAGCIAEARASIDTLQCQLVWAEHEAQAIPDDLARAQLMLEALQLQLRDIELSGRAT